MTYPELKTDRLMALRNHMQLMAEREAQGVRPTDRAFYMGMWFADANAAFSDAERQHIDYGLEVCGTACCLLGEATQVPELASQGLVLRKDGYSKFMDVVAEPTSWYDWEDDPEGPSTLDSAMHFFGITHEEALFLFMPDRYEGEVEGWIDPEALDPNEYQALEEAGIDPDGDTFNTGKIRPKHCVTHIERVMAGELRTKQDG